jgi:hypothetical protein
MRIPQEGPCDPIAPLDLPHSLHAFHRVSACDSLNLVRNIFEMQPFSVTSFTCNVKADFDSYAIVLSAICNIEQHLIDFIFFRRATTHSVEDSGIILAWVRVICNLFNSITSNLKPFHQECLIVYGNHDSHNLNILQEWMHKYPMNFTLKEREIQRSSDTN